MYSKSRVFDLVTFRGIDLLLHTYFYFLAPNTHCALADGKKQVPFSMDIGYEKLMHECFGERQE